MSGNRNNANHSIPKPNWDPACEYVAIPDGVLVRSSSYQSRTLLALDKIRSPSSSSSTFLPSPLLSANAYPIIEVIYRICVFYNYN